MYSYFPNGEVTAVLGVEDSSKGIWWYPACRSNIEKYLAPFNWEKISSTFGMDQKFPCDLIKCAVVSD